MARITTIDEIKELSGKLSATGRFYVYTNRTSGKKSIRRIGNDPNKKPTEAQKAQREAFRQKVKAVSHWFAENRPSLEHPLGTEAYQQAQKSFKAQHEVGDMYHWVWKMLFRKRTA